MNDYSQGICEDGAALLKDGLPMTIEQILTELRSAQKPSAVVPESWIKVAKGAIDFAESDLCESCPKTAATHIKGLAGLIVSLAKQGQEL
jgi:hypothetical protein